MSNFIFTFQATSESVAMGIAFNSLLRSLISALSWEFAAQMPAIIAHCLKILAVKSSEEKKAHTKQVGKQFLRNE